MLCYQIRLLWITDCEFVEWGGKLPRLMVTGIRINGPEPICPT